MRRDMELIRKLAMELEVADSGLDSDAIDIDGYEQTVIDYHLKLMAEMEMIVLNVYRGGVTFIRMTSKGHDFVDSIRDDTVWKRARKMISETTKTVSFDMLKRIVELAASNMYPGLGG